MVEKYHFQLTSSLVKIKVKANIGNYSCVGSFSSRRVKLKSKKVK